MFRLLLTRLSRPMSFLAALVVLTASACAIRQGRIASAHDQTAIPRRP
jgi:hypothetical protein